MRGASLIQKTHTFQLNVGWKQSDDPSNLDQLVEQKSKTPILPIFVGKPKNRFLVFLFVGGAMVSLQKREEF